MRWFIYGSDCNASYNRVEQILRRHLKQGDVVETLTRFGVNEEVIEYCRKNGLMIKEHNLVGAESAELLFITRLLIARNDKCLFIFSEVEPPQLNYAYIMALQDKITDDILYDFI